MTFKWIKKTYHATPEYKTGRTDNDSMKMSFLYMSQKRN